MSTLHRCFCIMLYALSLAACDTHTSIVSSDEAAKEPAVTKAVAAAPSARTMKMWSGSCALCHVDGNGGAPRMGQAEEWLPRLAKGRETLLKHTVEGLNNMPPLGYCMACERDDLVTMIDFMTADIAAQAAGDKP